MSHRLDGGSSKIFAEPNYPCLIKIISLDRRFLFIYTYLVSNIIYMPTAYKYGLCW